MPSNFPNQLDEIALVQSPSTKDPDSVTLIPGNLLNEMDDATEAIEAHIGLGLFNGGGTRVDGTVFAPAEGRLLSVRTGTYTVSTINEGNYSLFVQPSSVLTESSLANNKLIQAPDQPTSNNTVASLLAQTQSPLFVSARRRSFGNNQLQCGVTSNPNGQALLTLTLPPDFSAGAPTNPFHGGEIIDIHILIFGG